MRGIHRRLLPAALAAAAASLVATTLPGSATSAPVAAASLRLADGTSVGWATFEQFKGHTLVRARVRNLPATVPGGTGFHGFHVHANDNPDNGTGCLADPAAAPSTWFVSADGHYTTPGATHPDHDGDLPPLLVLDDGTANHNIVTDRLDPTELDGKAVIVHALPDNHANIPLGDQADQYTANSAEAIAKTLATGNAGDRIACGVIRLQPA